MGEILIELVNPSKPEDRIPVSFEPFKAPWWERISDKIGDLLNYHQYRQQTIYPVRVARIGFTEDRVPKSLLVAEYPESDTIKDHTMVMIEGPERGILGRFFPHKLVTERYFGPVNNYNAPKELNVDPSRTPTARNLQPGRRLVYITRT